MANVISVTFRLKSFACCVARCFGTLMLAWANCSVLDLYILAILLRILQHSLLHE